MSQVVDEKKLSLKNNEYELKNNNVYYDRKIDVYLQHNGHLKKYYYHLKHY